MNNLPKAREILAFVLIVLLVTVNGARCPSRGQNSRDFVREVSKKASVVRKRAEAVSQKAQDDIRKEVQEAPQGPERLNALSEFLNERKGN